MKSMIKKMIFWISAFLFMAMIIAGIIWMHLPGQNFMKMLICPASFLLFFIVGLMVTIYDNKKRKKYQSQYISEIIIQDKAFGEIRLEKDSKLNRLVCKNFPKPFGTYNPPLYIEEYDESLIDFYFRNLECLYDRQEEILRALRKARKEEPQVEIEIEKCGEYFWDEKFELTDLGSKFFEVRPEDWVVSVTYPDHPGEPVLTAYMDCRTKAICYVESD